MTTMKKVNLNTATIETITVKTPFFVTDDETFGLFAEYSAYDHIRFEKQLAYDKTVDALNKATQDCKETDEAVEILRNAGRPDDEIDEATDKAVKAGKALSDAKTRRDKALKILDIVLAFEDEFSEPSGYVETAIVNGYAQFFIGGFKLYAEPFKPMKQMAVAYERDYHGETWTAGRKHAFNALREVLEINYTKRLNDAVEALPNMFKRAEIDLSSKAVELYASSCFTGWKAETQRDKVVASREKYANAAKAANQFYGLVFNKLGADFKELKSKDYKGAIA